MKKIILLIFALTLICQVSAYFSWNDTYINYPSCYQESANDSNQNNESCNLTYNGNYQLWGEGTWNVPNKIYDNDFSTNATKGTNNEEYLDVNYSKPTNYYSSTNSIWRVKTGAGVKEVFINDTCLTQDKVILRVRLYSGDTVYSCYNGTDYKVIGNGPSASAYLYEEAFIWKNLTLYLSNTLGTPWGSLEDLNNLSYNPIIYNPSTYIVNFSYNDSSQAFTSSNLLIYYLNYSSTDSLICNLSNTSNPASLTCNITGNQSGSYYAVVYITRSGITSLIDTESFSIESFSSTIGNLGLFYGIFILLIIVFVFSYNEITAIWSFVIGIIMLNLIQIINFGAIFITALIGIALIITILLKR